MAVDPSGALKGEFASALFEAIEAAFPKTGLTRENVDASITTPHSAHGDLSSSIAMRLARLVKKTPHQAAEAVVPLLKPSAHLKEYKEVNGYINAIINENEYAALVLQGIASSAEKYGMNDAGKGRKAIVEFPSANPNKPWHIGQLRNALLGDCIANMLSMSSYGVERQDYIDDLGLQIAESVWGWLHLSDKPDKKMDQWLGEQYVQVNRLMKEKDITGEINDILKRMEHADTKEAKLTREIATKCIRAQYETAFAYRIYHDTLVWESDIVGTRLLEKALKYADEKRATEKPSVGKYANCIVIDLKRVKDRDFENLEEPVKVLVRSNGAATYAVKDFAFHTWKTGMFPADFKFETFMEKQPNGRPLYTTSSRGSAMKFGAADLIVNVIGAEQIFEQKIVKAMFALVGDQARADSIIHLAYGLVSVSGGSLSARTGGWIGEGRNYTADDLLREVKEKAAGIVKANEKITEKSSIERIAEAVALGAIKFEFLRVTPEKEVIFSWEKALDFESNSGPYCMYTYARASRILEKGDVKSVKLAKSDYAYVTRGRDLDLIKLMGECPSVLERASRERKPSIITEYLLELGSTFSKFYETMPVLKGGEAMKLRLAIVSAMRQVMGNMLAVLGIETLERM